MPRRTTKRNIRRASVTPRGKKSAQSKLQVSPGELPLEDHGAPPTLWVDYAEAYTRDDMPLATLRLYAALHDRKKEVCRLQMTVPHLLAIRDLIDRITEKFRDDNTE